MRNSEEEKESGRVGAKPLFTTQKLGGGGSREGGGGST